MLGRNLPVLLFLFGFFFFSSNEPLADERQSAAQAARDIMSAFSDRQYKQIWDTQMSEVFQKQMTEDSFLANMSIGRAQLVKFSSSKIVDVQYSERDPATGYKGKIYAFTFLNIYAVGRFYERIVVNKENDGIYRLAGLWGSPAPSQ